MVRGDGLVHGSEGGEHRAACGATCLAVVVQHSAAPQQEVLQMGGARHALRNQLHQAAPTINNKTIDNGNNSSNTNGNSKHDNDNDDDDDDNNNGDA